MIRSYLEGPEGREDYRYPLRVAVVVRWLVLVGWLALMNYRTDLDQTTQLTMNALAIPLLAVNGYVHWRINSGRGVTVVYVFALSLLDITLITAGLALTSAFANTFFVFYYPALVGFSITFHRRRAVSTLAAIAIGSYIFISIVVDPGLSTDLAEERVLLARVLTMVGVVAASNLMTRLERARRIAAVNVERERSDEILELQRTAMSAEIAVTEERGRIARELHDGIAQEVYMIGLGLETALELVGRKPDEVRERLTALMPLAKQALLHTRNYLYDLKPLLDGEQQLPELAKNQAREFTAITGLPVEVTVQGDQRSIEIPRATAIYRVIQESLANVLKHAQASKVHVVISYEPDAVRVKIEDDGVGFDLATHHVGYGLTNIREQAEELGGQCEMITNAGQGTVVTIRVPA